MHKIFNEYFSQDIVWDGKNLKILEHVKIVANAAKRIANKSDCLDPEKAYTYGLMHDIGKFFLSKKESYKHPLLGYELLKDNYIDIAEICLSHPFPTPSFDDYFLHYCKGDSVEAVKISDSLKTLKNNNYMMLIQFCDKISGLDNYVTLDEKFAWYASNYSIDKHIIDQRFVMYLDIKTHLEKITKMNIYEMFGL